MLVDCRRAVRIVDRRPDLIGIRRINGKQRFVLVGRLRDPRHIQRGNVLRIPIQAGRIVKMALRTAQLCELFIHHIDKSGDASGHMLRQRVGRLIGGN